MAVSSMVETGVSFANAEGKWLKHSVALDLEIVEARLDEPALGKWQKLPLTKQILAIRAIEELMLCTFRRTRKDPDYREGEEDAWMAVLEKLIGTEGLDRVGL